MSRIVVKVGTTTLAYPNGRLNLRHIKQLVRVLSDLKNAGHEIILVTSGAIGIGTGRLSLGKRPADMPGKQAAAAVGQCRLMDIYDSEFSAFDHIVAQILLTNEDLSNDERRHNFENTIFRLLEWNVLPILNENDTIATSEIAVGDNDTLSAIVSVCIHADMTVLLSDIDGLYTADPRKDPEAVKIDLVPEITPEILSLAGASGSSQGTGGMITKLRAAEICTAAGIDLIICNGEQPELLYDLLDGKQVGTRFSGGAK